MFIEGKLTPQYCEDELFVSDDFIAVIDGVTSKSDFCFKGKTTGKIIVEMIVEILQTLKRDSTVNEFLQEINSAIAHFYHNVSFPYDKSETGLQAVCAIYSDFHREIWLIGDCQVMVDGRVHTSQKKSDCVLAEMRSLMIGCLISQKQNVECDAAQNIARNVIEPWILKSNCYANSLDTRFGYAMINGQDIPRELIHIIPCDEGKHEVILTSDGYPEVKPTLELSETYLFEILKKDPMCWERYPSTKGVKAGQKSFDDRAYIRFCI